MTGAGGPLAGLKVVVTRPRAQAGDLIALLEDRGARVVVFPTIEIGAPSSWAPLDRAIEGLAEGRYQWVLFSSVNGVAGFFERVRAAGKDGGVLGRCSVAAVGPQTAAALAARGAAAGLVPERFTAEDLAAALGRGPGRVLLPRAEGAPQHVIDALKESGFSPEAVPAYRTLPARPEAGKTAQLKRGDFDVVTFTSASTVKGFLDLLGRPEALGLSGAPAASRAGKVVGCIGPRTAEAARALGVRVDVVARDHTAEGLVAALEVCLASVRQESSLRR
ncbi:MAG TPA: uroporphyrinogen-III synthase [Actinomycetota bacterium]|nr:uroporphyrinogen-III synthase [Actinomycetota bacterium]